MADHNDEHEDKGHCLSDPVKCAVLVWSAGLLDHVIPRHLPITEDGQHVRNQPADRIYGVVRD